VLTEILVRDLGVIEHAEVTFGGGGTALTGETGAGKTLVVVAIGLLLGDRADRTLVRTGSERAAVEGRIVLPADHGLRSVLEEADLIEGDEGSIELVVSRTVEAEGGGKARINGRLVTLSLLSDICGSLLEIAGQHAHQRISKSAQQRALLDALAGPKCAALARDVESGVAAARQASRRLSDLRSRARERAAELDALRGEIAEIEEASLEPGEIARLKGEAERLEHAETIASNVLRAGGLLRSEGGVDEALQGAELAMNEAARHDPALGELARRLESTRYEIEDITIELRERVVTPDPDALQRVRTRLDALGRLRRRYGEDERSILSYLERARARALDLEVEEDEVGRVQSEADGLWSKTRTKAERLSEMRRSELPKIESDVEAWLNLLALAGASFGVRLTACDLFEGGLEEVAFLVSTNPGEEERPVSKVASGGELARIALALQLVSSTQDTTAGPVTVVFDEVDAGVGGGAARAVGSSLARLARSQGLQVLVVTHLPQVAAFADHHLKVSKDTGSGRSRARVESLTDEGRILELSRMLAGMPESGPAQDHARELLEAAEKNADAVP
jgi:DNA repair protein RecN (Recombination protein N)